MEELNEKGYPQRIKIAIETKNKKISATYSNFENKTFSIDIEELINKLEDLFIEQNNSLFKICKINPLMRFFYGKQFFLLSKYIDFYKLGKKDNLVKQETIQIYEQKVLSLLTYLTDISFFNENKKTTKDELEKIIQNKQMNEIDKNLSKISVFLELLFSQNNITVEKLLTPNKIINNKYQGFYIVEIILFMYFLFY